MKKRLVLLLCLLLLSGCGKVPQLKNGEESVVSFEKDGKKYNITANDLYNDLKSNYGLKSTIKMIDKYIFETEFTSFLKEAKDQADSQVKAYANMFGGEKEFEQMLQSNYNYASLDAYKEDVYASVLQTHAMEEYAKTLITDKDVEKYYNEKVEGDVELYHILVTPKVTDKMKDEEKKQAENSAKKILTDALKKLNEADNKLETFKTLAKEYSIDESTKDKGGLLGYLNYGDLNSNYDELLNTAFKLKNNEYSKDVITSELGYHIIYRSNQKEKDALKDIKEEIISTLAEEKIASNKDIDLESIKHYRKLYNMNINDDELNRQYGIYLNNLANQSN